MKRIHAIPLVFTMLWLGQANVSLAAFAPGEILLVSRSTTVSRYLPSGVRVQTYVGADGPWKGLSLTPQGNFVTNRTNPIGIDTFDPSGSQIGSFNVSPLLAYPSDVSVFADGTLAINAANSRILFYSPSGTLLRFATYPSFLPTPRGSTVGTDNTLYVSFQNSTGISRVTEGGTFLTDIPTNFLVGDVVMHPTDGTLWATGSATGTITHLSTTGTVLGSFPTGLPVGHPDIEGGDFLGIGIAPDGSSLYATTGSSTVIRHFDLSGNQLGDFNIVSPNGPTFMTVVPGSVSAPEPTSAALLLGGGALLAPRRRRG